MIGILVVYGYVIIGFITAFVLRGYLEKKLGVGSAGGTWMIMYLNVFFWPFFFPMMMLQAKKEAKKKDA